MKDLMLQKAHEAMKKAHAIYSHYHVGACVRSENGSLFSGANIENASYGLTLCAEAVALAAMWMAGQKQVKEVLVMADAETTCTPCGACRQRIREFAEPNTPIHLCNRDGIVKTVTLDYLLPESFTSQHFITEHDHERK